MALNHLKSGYMNRKFDFAWFGHLSSPSCFFFMYYIMGKSLKCKSICFSLKPDLTEWKKHKYPGEAVWNGPGSQADTGPSPPPLPLTALYNVGQVI